MATELGGDEASYVAHLQSDSAISVDILETSAKGTVPFEQFILHEIEWMSYSCDVHDLRYKYVLSALTNYGSLTLAILPEITNLNGKETYYADICMSQVDITEYINVRVQTWERASHGDPLLSAAMCRCEALVENCDGSQNLCEIRKMFKDQMFMRRIYRDDDVSIFLRVFKYCGFTPEILGSRDLIKRHRALRKQMREDEVAKEEKVKRESIESEKQEVEE